MKATIVFDNTTTRADLKPDWGFACFVEINAKKILFDTGANGIEQAMAVKTNKGLLIVAGCSHPAMHKTLAAAAQFGNIYGIVGGLHGFDQYDLFKDLQLICPTHCTQHIREIKERFPEKYIKGGAGKVISVS